MCSIDMHFAPPLIVVQVYNMSNRHWVLRLFLIGPIREYFCLNFDPMCDRPHVTLLDHTSRVWVLWI